MKIIENKKILKTLLIIILISLTVQLTIKNTNTNKLSSTNSNSNTKSAFSTNEKNYLTFQKSLLSTPEIKVLNVIKKSPRISTEGLFFDNGTIFESGFYKNKSFLLKKNYQNKKIIKTVPLLSLTGKGIAKCGNKFFQLTEKEKKVITYSYPDLDLISSNSLDSEMEKGEGLSNLTENNLVATDGTNNLHIMDCTGELYVLKSIPVFDIKGNPMYGLQDITVVGDYVYANRENDNNILKIDPKNGAVVKSYDLMNLINYELKMKSLSTNDIATGSILNGITYDERRKVFILTGRNWAYYYEVNLN